MSVFSRKQLLSSLLENRVNEYKDGWAYTDDDHWVRGVFATRAEAQVALLEYVIEQDQLEGELEFQAVRLEYHGVAPC